MLPAVPLIALAAVAVTPISAPAAAVALAFDDSAPVGRACVAVTLRLAAVILPPTCASTVGETVDVAWETPTASAPTDTPSEVACALGVSVAATTTAPRADIVPMPVYARTTGDVSAFATEPAPENMPPVAAVALALDESVAVARMVSELTPVTWPSICARTDPLAVAFEIVVPIPTAPTARP